MHVVDFELAGGIHHEMPLPVIRMIAALRATDHVGWCEARPPTDSLV
jgi:hypothetical protein